MTTSFTHPGILHTVDDITFIKEKVASGEEPWKTAYENLIKSDTASLDFKPEPHTHVIRGAYGKPSIGDKELTNSANAAHHHALLWVINEKQDHADKAIEILNAWSYVLWDFQLNDAKLLAAWTGDALCNAAEILRHTDSGWQEKDITQFTRMMRTVYVPLLKNFFPEANGNWDGAIINTLLAIGVFCDDHDLFSSAINHYLRGRGNGGITKYIYPHGQCQESTRDQSHTQLGLNEFALASQIAWNQGVDLYQTADNRLALGFEHAAKYMLGEEVYTYGPISDQGRERIWDIYETVYQHYRHIKGIDMPNCERAVEKTRTQEKSITALFLYKGPTEVHTPRTSPNQPSVQAPQPGAQDQPTSQPPENAILVSPEDDLQTKLKACPENGWIVLSKGIHTVPQTIKLPNNITVSGQGLETILILDAKTTGAVFINAHDDLHNVTLRDFVIEGDTSPEVPRDPNSGRRRRSYANAPARKGIDFAAQTANQMRDIYFEHLTVQNCTLDGVAIRGAQNIAIVACDFSDSGASVVPGPGLQHNLLITRSCAVTVRGCRLDTSPCGSGLDISHSQDMTITNNELARNALHGIHLTESNVARITNNLAEGNDGHGITCDTQMDGCHDLEISTNIARNNSQAGIHLDQVKLRAMQNNLLSDNGQDE